MATGVLGFSDAYFHKILQRAVTGGTPAMAATPYVGLLTTAPTGGDFAGLVELVAGDYGRKLAGFGTPATRQARLQGHRNSRASRDARRKRKIMLPSRCRSSRPCGRSVRRHRARCP